MSSNKTRASAALRNELIRSFNIRPAKAIQPALTQLERDALRAIGSRACSRVEAIIARRRELGKA